MKNRIGSQHIPSIGGVLVKDASPIELANALHQAGHPCGAVLLPSYYQFISNMEMAHKALSDRGIREIRKAPTGPPEEGDNHGGEEGDGNEG